MFFINSSEIIVEHKFLERSCLLQGFKISLLFKSPTTTVSSVPFLSCLGANTRPLWVIPLAPEILVMLVSMVSTRLS